MDVDYGAINGEMKRSLKSFFRSLEGSLSNDWECEIHYELILQQLRLLQSGDSTTNDGSRSGGELQAYCKLYRREVMPEYSTIGPYFPKLNKSLKDCLSYLQPEQK